MKSSKKYFVEGLGTFALVLIGCAAATVSGISESGLSGIGLLGIALAFGLAVAAMVYTIRLKNINLVNQGNYFKNVVRLMNVQ